MASQGVSRKRPAPGTSPMIHQQIHSIPNFPIPDSQLSNDQFLQWGQNAPAAPNPPHPDVDPYPPVSYPGNIEGLQPSNQLTRRPGNQLVTRGRLHDPNLPSMIDQGGVRSNGQGDTALVESEADLEQRALLAKKDAQAKRKQIPPFVQKLSSFLDESKNTDLIRWSDDGNSFIVLDEDEFAKTLIPELFKHNNYASFVRQLNMYGFHKKVGLSDNSMRASERKNKSPSEYSNPYFKRGHPDLLWLIQKPRNVTSQTAKGSQKTGVRVKSEGEGDDGDNDDLAEEGHGPRDERPKFRGQLSLGIGEAALAKEQLASVYRELQTIRHQQQVISNTINKLRREHEQLYGQAANFQEQHTRHENSINAILTFLATIYNRSLQGHEGTQAITNSLAGVIPQDQNQGNIVDVGNYVGADIAPGQRPFKRQPLLLKAPPLNAGDGQPIPGAAMSPSASSSQYDSPQSRRKPNIRNGSGIQSGNVEEVFDSSSPQNTSQQQPQQHTPQQGQHGSRYSPQRDIMSLIHSSNARSSLGSNLTDFPTVLSSLETSGGNSALTATQRADMLRLIANESHASDLTSSVSSNNALISPNPPPMPHNYPARLASTREEINNLVKMQAEQDRSVQNLTNLLQPLSPTGSIPGLGPDDMGTSIPPPLDLDQIFNSGDYFSDFPDLDKGAGLSGFADVHPGQENDHPGHGDGNPNEHVVADTGNDLFDFDSLQSGHIPDMFGDTANTIPNPRQPATGYFEGFENLNGSGSIDHTGLGDGSGGVGFSGGTGRGADAGRITETFTSSEATSPANTSVDDNPQGMDVGNITAIGGGAGRSPNVKRRKKNR